MSMLARTGTLFLLLAALILIPTQATPTHAAETVVVDAGDYWYCDSSYQNDVCVTEIDRGDTVRWEWVGSQFIFHTTTECGADCDNPTATPLWHSGPVLGGSPAYEYTFNQGGSFLYYCTVHPFAMRGEIIVNAPVGGVAELPDVAAAPLTNDASSGANAALVAALAAAAFAVIATFSGTTWYLRRRAARSE